MNDKINYRELGIKAIAVIYMSALTVLISYYISKIYEEELWENERFALTAFISIAFLVVLAYLVAVEKGLIALMCMYHFVLLGTIACVAIPIKFMPFMLMPMVVTAVYDIKAGLMVTIAVSSVLIMDFTEYPMYWFGMILPAVGGTSCFAVWKHKKMYKNIAGSIFYIVTELAALLVFKEYCEGTGYEYENAGFVVTMLLTGIIVMAVANVAGVGINWLVKKKAPSFYLKKISDDSYVAVRLIKNKSTSLYYHSTEVAELARLAARRIGADEELAYAGGMYHDLGKIAGSEYIKEGLALADKHGIPKSVKAIMVEHNVKSRLPRSKEAAIVMLCDTAISAVEYLKGTMDKKDMSEKVIMENALNKRVSSGALHKSGLTIEEFDKIKEVLIKIKEQQ